MSHDHNDVEILRDTLVGRSVTSVQLGGEDLPEDPYRYERAEGKIVLDDGTVLFLGGNDGGCSCGAGDYALTKLNGTPVNGIMNVEVVVDGDANDPYSEPDLTYRIFVLAQDNRFELAAFEGNDGNGYYGTGFWFTVQRPETS